MIAAIFLGVCAIGLSACATNRTYGAAPDIQLTDLQSLPSPDNAGFYKIGPQEILDIKVVGSELLSSKFITDARGRIDFPLVGNVDLSNQTPTDASRIIASELQGEYVLNPQVIVIPEELNQASFNVAGQVNRPGDYPADSNMTLLRAISIAGGQAEYADLEEVLVFRTVEGQRYIGAYNLAAIQQGNYPDPRIYAQDIVMVGDSPGERRLDRILQIIPVLSTAVILIDRVGQ